MAHCNGIIIKITVIKEILMYPLSVNYIYLFYIPTAVSYSSSPPILFPLPSLLNSLLCFNSKMGRPPIGIKIGCGGMEVESTYRFVGDTLVAGFYLILKCFQLYRIPFSTYGFKKLTVYLTRPKKKYSLAYYSENTMPNKGRVLKLQKKTH